MLIAHRGAGGTRFGCGKWSPPRRHTPPLGAGRSRARPRTAAGACHLGLSRTGVRRNDSLPPSGMICSRRRVVRQLGIITVSSRNGAPCGIAGFVIGNQLPATVASSPAFRKTSRSGNCSCRARSDLESRLVDGLPALSNTGPDVRRSSPTPATLGSPPRAVFLFRRTVPVLGASVAVSTAGCRR